MSTAVNDSVRRVDELAARLRREWPEDSGAEDIRSCAESTIEYRDDLWDRVVPRRFQSARIGDLDGAAAEAVAEWRTESFRNLVLLGGVGSGKTHAAVAALRLANEAGMSLAFWPVVELLDALRPRGDDSAFDRACRVDFLCLDDLGTERPTDWTAERLYALVNRRWLEGLPIIATSNLSARNGKGPLVDALGPRMYSRLVHEAVVVQVAGEDRRRS